MDQTNLVDQKSENVWIKQLGKFQVWGTAVQEVTKSLNISEQTISSLVSTATTLTQS